MLTETERFILKVFSERHLLSTNEIASVLKNRSDDGVASTLKDMISDGYLQKVESLGNCFIITKKGIQALK
jgi:predicted transcriptional regulator